MKICFLTWILESTSQDKKVNEYIPVGPMLLASLLKDNGNEVNIYNVGKRINELPYNLFQEELYDTIVEELLSGEYNVYAFSTIIEGFQFQLYIANRMKELLLDATILFGGPQASVYSEEILRDFKCVDYIIRGEAENSICNFIDFINGKIPASDVKGLSYRNEGIIVNNPDAPIIYDLDTLPQLSLDTFDISSFDYFPIEVGRGCPFNCTFCATSGYFKQKFRMKSVDKIISEISFFIDRYNITRFNFLHDLFTFNKSVIMEFCDKLENEKIDIQWTCSVRADTIDKEILDRMNDVGCIGIYCGVETGSKRMQKETNKNLDIDKSSEIIQYAEEAQLKCMLSFVYGFPQERYEDILDTLKLINRLIKCGVQVAHPKVLKPVKGSPIYNEYLLFDYNKNVYSQRNIMLLKEFYKYDNSDSIDTYVEDMIAKYSEVFSYYYVYKPEILSVNTLLALGIIISSDNFSTSEKLLLEVQDFDYIKMLKSFDVLSLQEDIRSYEKHYIDYLRNEGENNEIVDRIYEVATYEKDKLEFKRLINLKFSSDNVIIRAYKYNYKVDKINDLKDFNKLSDLIPEESHYLFYFSKKNMTLQVFAINAVLSNFIRDYLADADINEIKQILNNDEVRKIPVLSLIYDSLST